MMRLKKSLFLALSLVALSLSVQAQSTQQRPNILVLLADDWGWPHAGTYGDTVIRTPTFDSLATVGMLFTHAFCAAPSCSPSRAALLTGQYPHRLEAGSSLWGTLSKKFATYTGLLEKAGYKVGSFQKGYGPGDITAGGYTENPAGKRYPDFATFLRQLPDGQPFCFWYGSHDPHRPYKKGSGMTHGEDPSQVQVPADLPDVPLVRKDLLDYYAEVERFDRHCGKILRLLREKGLLENTLVVISGDNGRPFPRAKANLYDGGTHIPLAIAWAGKIQPGTTRKELVCLSDLAPTFLKAAGLQVPEEMTGHSMLPLLKQQPGADWPDTLMLEIERHAYVRPDNVGYPRRGLRTQDFLYIRNFETDRWPAGNPEAIYSVGPFGDCDPSPTKDFILTQRSMHLHRDSAAPTYFQLAFGKRPAEELYDLQKDPGELHNVATVKKYKQTLLSFRRQLQQQMRQSADPRAADPHTAVFDHYPYYGNPRKN